MSAVGPSSTRNATLVSNSRSSRARSCRDVLLTVDFSPGERRLIDRELHAQGRLADLETWQGLRMLGIGDGVADRNRRKPREIDDLAGGRRLHGEALERLDGEHRGDALDLPRARRGAADDGLSRVNGASLNAPECEAPAPVVVIEVAHQHLQRAVGIRAGRRHVFENRVEEWLERHAGAGEIGGRRALTRIRVENRRIQLPRLLGELEQQVVRCLNRLGGLGVGTIDLVDHDDRLQAERERLAQDNPRLRHRPLGRIHEQAGTRRPSRGRAPPRPRSPRGPGCR